MVFETGLVNPANAKTRPKISRFVCVQQKDLCIQLTCSNEMFEVFDEFKELPHFPNMHDEFRFSHRKCKQSVNGECVLFKIFGQGADGNDIRDDIHKNNQAYNHMLATDQRWFTRLIHGYA